MKQGFTLIELLVVVLIIGILASVALPQYHKIIVRLQVQEIAQIAKKIYDHEQWYRQLNGKFTEDFSEFDVTYPQLTPVGGNSHAHLFKKDGRRVFTVVPGTKNFVVSDWKQGVYRYQFQIWLTNGPTSGNCTVTGTGNPYSEYACKIFLDEFNGNI